MTLILFTGTVFLSASLLFFVQPLYAKIVLPKIGGAPAVWTTAMLFFQTVLILGYLYAHFVTRHLPVRAQIGLHAVLWLLALTFLPLAAPEGWQLDVSGSVSLQTLALFAGGVGLPFAVLAANAPLIQYWYARTDGPSAADPYFLYGASNLGSLIALLGFPLVAEPFFSAGAIGLVFAGGFVALGALLLGCGLMARGETAEAGRSAAPKAPPLAPSRYAGWIILAFVPSSLMLAVTTKISTDFGSLPLIWVVPLSLYLLTFVIAFARRQLLSPGLLNGAGAAGLALVGLVFFGATGGAASINSVLLVTAGFFLVALWAHGRLYATRPDSAHLTGFYLALSVGGACGGLFNAIFAPLVFDAIWEGHVTVIVAAVAFVVPFTTLTAPLLVRAIALSLALGAGVALVQNATGLDRPLFAALGLGTALVAAALLRRHIVAASVALLCTFLAPFPFLTSDALFQDRSFFGEHRVVENDSFRLYQNGTTLHGLQALEELAADRPTPASYYHPLGAMGRLLGSEEAAELGSIGIVGLGTGALTCYRTEGQRWTLYEIDPVVEYIARDSGLFTYVPTCVGDTPTLLGDARVVLAAQPEVTFDLLVIDAYASDAIPVHLTTLEAIALYKDRLNAGGVILFHISNRFYDLAPQLARVADVLGMTPWRYTQPEIDLDAAPGFTPHDMVAFTSAGTRFAPLTDSPDWRRIASDGGRVWTDDHANVLGALKILQRAGPLRD